MAYSNPPSGVMTGWGICRRRTIRNRRVAAKMPSESLRSDGIFVWVMYGRSRGCRLERRSGIGGELLAERQEFFELGDDAVLLGKRWKRNNNLLYLILIKVFYYTT